MTLPSGIEFPDAPITEICRRYGIRELAVFGSAACGDSHPGSDIDVLVEFKPDTHLGWKFFDAADELEYLLGRPVDLGTKDSLKPHARAAQERLRRRGVRQKRYAYS